MLYYSILVFILVVSPGFSNPEPTSHQPLVLISFLARNAAPTLPYFLGQLEELDYPKDRLRIHIRSDHNSDDTPKILKRWVEGVRDLYESVDFRSESTSSYSDESGPFDWTDKRYRHIIDLKEAVLSKAKISDVDYILFLDTDVFLTNQRVLQHLIAAEKTVVSPMLRSPGSNYSNYWAAVDEAGYYSRADHYFTILFQEEIGCFSVPVIHTIFLIDLNAEGAHALSFEPNGLPFYEGKPIDDILVFAHSARVANVDLHVLNTDFFGYAFMPLEPYLQLEDLTEQMTYFLLQLMREDLMPLLYSPFAHPIYPTGDKMGFDQVYLINLLRRPERFDRMSASLRLLGINTTHWHAFDGQQITDNYLNTNGISMLPGYRDPYHQRVLTKGEVGCFLSHLSIWKDVIENNYQKVIVFEDDISFGNYFRPLLNAVMSDLNRTGQDWDLIYLGRKRMAAQDEDVLPGHRFLSNVVYSYWTLGYLLSQSGARKLLEPEPWKKLVAVDEYLPIMFDQHPDESWKSYFPNRNLIAFSTDPLLVYPSHYTNEPGYISDTENSHIVQVTGETETIQKQPAVRVPKDEL